MLTVVQVQTALKKRHDPFTHGVHRLVEKINR